jgi:hypothetical protein
MKNDTSNARPITHQRNLAKLPIALAPLIARKQWTVWRWTQKPDGNWQKPPFLALQPERHASTSDPGTWSDYTTALATVQAGHADGLSYILTKDDPFGAIDLDHCRCLVTHSIDKWAQNYLQAAVNTYQEITPSGEGVRIWGFTDGDPLNRKFTLKIEGKDIAAELFRRTNKALTITGYTLDPAIREFSNIDKVFDWALVWGERRKAAEQKTPIEGNGFDRSGCKYGIDDIEQIVREGAPAGANRSDLFHAIVGHYVGCDWDIDRIVAHLQEYPQGALAAVISLKIVYVGKSNAARRSLRRWSCRCSRRRWSRNRLSRRNPSRMTINWRMMILMRKKMSRMILTCRGFMHTVILIRDRSRVG